MSAHTRQPRSRRVLAGVMVCAALIVGAYWSLRPSPRSQTSAVHEFVRDLNAADSAALSHDLYAFGRDGSDVGSADPGEIISHAKQPWVVSVLTISDGTRPGSATAWVTGTANGTRFQTSLPLYRRHGRWYVIVTSDRVDLQPA